MARQNRYIGVFDKFIHEGHEALSSFAKTDRVNFNEKESASIYYGIMASAVKHNIELDSKACIESAAKSFLSGMSWKGFTDSKQECVTSWTKLFATNEVQFTDKAIDNFLAFVDHMSCSADTYVSLGDAVEIKEKITATRKELWVVRDKLNDKKMKLAQAKLQLYELQKNTSHIEARNREIKADFEKTAVSYQQQIINKIWAQAGMKALAKIADIYPRMTSTHDSSLFDDSFAMDFINYGDKIIYCAMYLYVGYINEAINFAESQGGGGSDTKDWGREKDENEIEWIRRCLRQATRMVKPIKRKGLRR